MNHDTLLKNRKVLVGSVADQATSTPVTPSIERPLLETLAVIRFDAQQRPAEYLKATEVPHGGE